MQNLISDLIAKGQPGPTSSEACYIVSQATPLSLEIVRETRSQSQSQSQFISSHGQGYTKEWILC